MIKIGLIQFPGSNCERETALAIKRAGMIPEEFLWNEPLEKLVSLDGYVIIGGFSYEDRSRAGIIAALDPVIQEITKQSQLGKPVLGICNGAQILLEAGLLPGLDTTSMSMALTENKRIKDGKVLGLGFYNAWAKIRLSDNHPKNAYTRFLTKNDILHLPVAHAEGRFIMSSDVLNAIESHGLNLFQYCNEQGIIENNFPVNPNGSIGNIAAISNKAGNVMAMMPHPERTTNGDPIFHSMREYIKENDYSPINNPVVSQVTIKPESFKKTTPYLCLTQLNITDNQALTVQKTLRKLGFPIMVQRYSLWEIDCDSLDSLDKIKGSDLLYCPRKEREIKMSELPSTSAVSYVVRPKDNIIGLKTMQSLKKHYGIQQINTIKHSVLWQFSAHECNIHEQIEGILQTNIIGNRYAHECFKYNDL